MEAAFWANVSARLGLVLRGTGGLALAACVAPLLSEMGTELASLMSESQQVHPPPAVPCPASPEPHHDLTGWVPN